MLSASVRGSACFYKWGNEGKKCDEVLHVRCRPATAKGARKWYRAPWLSPPPSICGNFLPHFRQCGKAYRITLNRIRLRRLFVRKTNKRRYIGITSVLRIYGFDETAANKFLHTLESVLNFYYLGGLARITGNYGHTFFCFHFFKFFKIIVTPCSAPQYNSRRRSRCGKW